MYKKMHVFNMRKIRD